MKITLAKRSVLLIGLLISLCCLANEPAEEMEFIEVEDILSGESDQKTPGPEPEYSSPEDNFIDLDRILYGTDPDQPYDSGQPDEKQQRSLQQDIADLKNKVLNINRDLFILEEDLLFPSSTQINVFVGSDAAEYFQIDSITLKINDAVVSSHLYTERELNALNRGAIQRLYTGNLPIGEHEVVALVIGLGPEGRDYKRAVHLEFKKNSGTKFIQLQINADDLRKRPNFHMKQWE